MAKVTLRDVAEAAGVSIATASWAVTDNRDVQITESTRRKVRRAADELGYYHNALARGLARGCSDIIGFISDGVATSPFAGQVIQGAQDEAWRNGKILLVVDTDGRKDVERRTFSFMFEHQVEGIIYSKWVHGSITPPDELGRMPSVLVNCYDECGRFPAVVPDEVQGGATATRLLLEAGHRRIAFVNDAAPSPASVGRLAGYKAALAQFDVDFDPSLVLSVTADQEGGYGAAAQVLATGATGVFCHNDRTALGLYDALRESGKRMPDDISVVGFDNQEVISAHMHPALTTVGLPQYDLGVMGVRTLLRRCGADNDESEIVSERFKPVHVQCPAVPRDSVRTL